MKASVARTIESISSHPTLNMVVGLFLLASGVSEIIVELEEEFTLGAHHGMAVFGFVHCFKTLPLFLKALK